MKIAISIISIYISIYHIYIMQAPGVKKHTHSFCKKQVESQDKQDRFLCWSANNEKSLSHQMLNASHDTW